MRILHVIDHLGLGGAQTVLAEILSSWPARSDNITVMALGRAADLRCRVDAIPNVNVKICAGWKWDVRAVRRVAREIRRGSYDVVHAHLTKSLACVLASMKHVNARCVIHLHNDPTTDHHLLRWAIGRWSKRINLAVAVSHHTARIARELFPELDERLAVIHNGVDFDDLDRVSNNPSLREQHGLAPDDILFGFAGRLAEQKGVTYLLRAMSLVVKRRRDVKLMVMGDGPLRKNLEDESNRLGICEHVDFIGFHQNGRSWMRQFDVGVLPSLHEGLPMTLVEMMGVGVPVIATRVSGTPEIVQHQRSGLLVQPRDVDGLAEAIVTYARQPQLRKEHGEAAKRDVRERFCIRRTATTLRTLYADLMQDRTGGAVVCDAAEITEYHA